jgi:hypothetical protein
MRVSPPLTMALLLGLASVVSYYRSTSVRSANVERANVWAEIAVSWRQGQPTSADAAHYWTRRVPAAEVIDTISATDPWLFWATGAGQEVWGVSALAGMEAASVPTQAVPLVAMSTASFLGIDLPDTKEVFESLSQEVVGSLQPWRFVLRQRCGDCAPRSSPLPIVREMWTPATMNSHPINSRSATLATERLRRSVVALIDERVPMTSMMVRIRRGKAPTVAEWNTRGLAGMAALELAMASRSELLPEVLDCARRGPSRTDRIAALWAARAMGSTDPLIEQIEAAL